jgi:hypothetical protein
VEMDIEVPEGFEPLPVPEPAGLAALPATFAESAFPFAEE